MGTFFDDAERVRDLAPFRSFIACFSDVVGQKIAYPWSNAFVVHGSLGMKPLMETQGVSRVRRQDFHWKTISLYNPWMKIRA